MSSHRDADAFVRAFLHNPKDETARLVFADWLEDRGEPHHAAWAGYIRAKAAAARVEFGTAAWRASDDEAAEFAPDVAANLSLPVGFFLRYPASLLRLLPAANIAVRIGPFRPTTAVVGRVPEAYARHFPLLPLDDSAGALLVAYPGPVTPRLVASVRAELPRTTVVVGGSRNDVIPAINAAYAGAAGQDELLNRMTPDFAEEFAPRGDIYPVARGGEFVDDVLAACGRRGADLVSFVPQDDTVRVQARVRGRVIEVVRLSRLEWESIVMPVILARGEATGTEFTVEVVRNGADRAVRIWL